MHRSTKSVLALFLAVPLATARQEVQLCGTHPDKAIEEAALHRASRRRNPALRTASRTASRDIGNIAVIEDSEGVVARRNSFNLDRRQVRFVPAATASRYRFEVSDAGYDPSLADRGTPVSGLGDDDTRDIAIPFSFPFYGQQFSRVFLNSDGNLTFGEGDTSTSERSIGRATSGPGRIAAFFDDLDPSQTSGGVRVLAEATQFVVSWVNVPEFSPSGFGARQTFQIRLYPDGRIEFAFSGIGAQSAVTGIAPGRLRGISSVVAFTAGSSQEFTGAILERFTAFEEIDTVFLAQKFYENHDDAYDFLVIYNTLNIDASPGAVAFESTVRSSHLGIGDAILDEGTIYGSPRRLQAVLNLGQTSQYPRDSNALVPARQLSRDTPLSIIGHETGHLWLALASVREPPNTSNRPMLGRQSAHWAFTFNSDASLMEGNRIQDNGATEFPRFRTVAVTEAYAPLDQYLMGFRPPEEVPPTFYVANPSIGTGNRGPQIGVSFDGSRRDVFIDELIATEGRRVPDHTVSQRRYRFAFVLVTRAGAEPPAEDLEKVEDYRRLFEDYFNRTTGGRAFAETTLRRSLSLSLAPAAGVLAGSSANAVLTLARPAEAGLTVLLRTTTGAASAPASVTIAAGAVQAAFAIRGERPGVEELIAEPADGRYAAAHARVQVSSASAVSLAVFAGDKQAAVSGTPLPQPIRLRAVDRNQLPYPGVIVRAEVTAGGTVVPVSAATDADGFVSFVWTPGGGQLHELRASLAVNPEPAVLVTALGRPLLAAAGIANAASYSPGLTPGGIASAFGLNLAGGAVAAGRLPLTSELAGVRLLINGFPAPLLFVSDRQINFIAPAALATGEAEVIVTFGVGATAPVRVPVRPFDPGIFVQTGGLAAVNVRGGVLEIYCTGLGPVGGGFPQETLERPRVTVGGRDAEVLFSGLAPGTPGLYQVNARVPDGEGPGPRELQLTIGGAVSNRVQVLLPGSN